MPNVFRYLKIEEFFKFSNSTFEESSPGIG